MLQPCQPFLSGYHRPNAHALLIRVCILHGVVDCAQPLAGFVHSFFALTRQVHSFNQSLILFSTLRYTTSVPFFIMDDPTLSTRRPLRSNSFLWYMRIVQALMAAVVIGITGSNASDWHSWKCSLPSRLTYNIVCVRRALFGCFLCLTCHVTGIRNPASRPLSHLSLGSEELNSSLSLG